MNGFNGLSGRPDRACKSKKNVNNGLAGI